MRLLLHPRPPFDLARTVWALRRRNHNIIDRWQDGTWHRVLVLGRRAVPVAVTQTAGGRAPQLEVTVPGRVSAGAQHLLVETLERLLGSNVDLRGFYRMAARHPPLDELARRFRGLKPPRFPSLFEALVNGIACQQVSLEAGITLLDRLAEAFGQAAGDHFAFPLPEAVAGATEAELRGLGFSTFRSRALLELATRAATGDEALTGLDALDDAAVMERLEQLRGVGRWTAEYALLRGLGRLQVFPGDDVGARRRLEKWLTLRRPLDYADVRRVTAAWQPWAGMVYFHLLLRGLAERGIAL